MQIPKRLVAGMGVIVATLALTINGDIDGAAALMMIAGVGAALGVYEKAGTGKGE